MSSYVTVLTNDIKDLMYYFKRLRTNITILKNVNKKIVKRCKKTDRYRWSNTTFVCYNLKKCKDKKVVNLKKKERLFPDFT